jgi:hypothetical protein
LADKYSVERVETACIKAISYTPCPKLIKSADWGCGRFLGP